MSECNPTDLQFGERQEVLDFFCSRFLDRDVALVDLRTLPIAEYQKLDPVTMQRVYWTELDHIADWSRRRLLWLIQERIAWIADEAITPLASVMWLRQLIELTIWGASYQYGQTVSFNFLSQLRSKLKDQWVVSTELESLIRSAVVLDPKRHASALRAVGLEPPAVVDDQVGEFTATIAKQLGVLGFLARQMEGEDGLVQHADRLRHAYKWCCGLVHVTPVLLLWEADQASVPRLTKELRFTTAAAISSLLVILARLVYRDDFAKVSFAKLFPGTASITSVTDVSIPELLLLKERNKRVEFALPDGSKVLIYDPAASAD